MRITHVALLGPVTDNWNYQDNLLPKYHKKNGHDVTIITSKYIYDTNGKIILDQRDTYINENGIKTIRLNIKGDKPFGYKFKEYLYVYETIEAESPEVLFIHCCQFVDIKKIVKYVQTNHHIRVYVDNHADFSNSARSFFSKNILHKIIWRHYAHLIEPYTTKFYGVLPARVDFLKNVYKLPEEKIELLVMGADDEKVEEAKEPKIKEEIRKKNNVKQDDSLIITGGKIDNDKKQTLLLMEAVKRIKREDIKLIVFGSVADELKEEVNKLSDGNKIQYIGWINSEDSYKYFAASELVVFPGRHSVFWEQVVGIGIPMVVKYWDGTYHIDIGGNCKFLYDDSVDEIYNLLTSLINDKDELDKMRNIAESEGMKYFSYKNIAKIALGE